MLSSDKTHLTIGQGDKECHAIYMSCGNIKKALRGKVGAHCWMMIAQVPIAKFEQPEHQSILTTPEPDTQPQEECAAVDPRPGLRVEISERIRGQNVLDAAGSFPTIGSDHKTLLSQAHACRAFPWKLPQPYSALPSVVTTAHLGCLHQGTFQPCPQWLPHGQGAPQTCRPSWHGGDRCGTRNWIYPAPRAGTVK